MTLSYNLNFLDIWERIRNNTDLNTLTELAELLDTSQPYISRKKSQNVFPVEWAFIIASKYDLNTDWIMTGKGSCNNSDIDPDEEYQNKILDEIDTWLTDLIKKEPFRKEWFLGVFLDSFPSFVKHRKSQGRESKNNTNRNSKAA